MISFLRKIRQKILTQNRITRYVTYAIREIILEERILVCPVRDSLWVALQNVFFAIVPSGTTYKMAMANTHLAYLRHAWLFLFGFSTHW